MATLNHETAKQQPSTQSFWGSRRCRTLPRNALISVLFVDFFSLNFSLEQFPRYHLDMRIATHSPPRAREREREFTIPRESQEDKKRARALLTIQSVGVISAALSFGTLALCKCPRTAEAIRVAACCSFVFVFFKRSLRRAGCARRRRLAPERTVCVQ